MDLCNNVCFSFFFIQDNGYLYERGLANAPKVMINNSRLACFDYPDVDIKSPEIQLNSCLLPQSIGKEKGRCTLVRLNKMNKGMGFVICASEKGHLDDKFQRRVLKNVQWLPRFHTCAPLLHKHHGNSRLLYRAAIKQFAVDCLKPY